MQTEARDVGERAPGRRSRRGPEPWQVVVLVVALCFLAGVIGWRLNEPSHDSFGTVDVGFLSDMETHHNGAIALSFAYLAREHDPIVGHFAREIIVSQSQEMAAMNDYLNRAGSPPSASDDVAMDWMGHPVRPTEMPGMPSAAESARLNAAAGLATDDEFTHLMIRHHAGGAAMATFAAAHAENAGVRQFAASMAKTQRGEINEIDLRRVALGLPAVPRSEIRAVERIHPGS